MPRRPKPPRVSVGTDLPPVLWDAVREYSADSGLPINRIFEDATLAYLKRHGWEVETPKRSPK